MECSNNEDSSVDIIDAANLDSETIRKLRGDAVGDTMYSETFIAKSLLKLSDLEWNEELERDLEALWDMTLEKDVCEYLFQINYPSISISVLKNGFENGRLVEITLGILANMLCADLNEKYPIGDNEIGYILNALSSPHDDVGVVQQSFRFMRCLLTKLHMNVFENDELVQTILFVLSNSLNKEVLEEALHLLSYYDKNAMDIDVNESVKILEAVYVSIETLIQEFDQYSDLFSESAIIVLQHILQIFANIGVSYKNELKIKTVLDKESILQNFNSLCGSIIKHFNNQINWIDNTDIMENIYTQLYRACSTGIYKYNKNDCIEMIKTVEEVKKAKCLETHSFLLYPISAWISTVDKQVLQADMKNLVDANFIKCIRYLEENVDDHDIRSNCRDILLSNKS